MAENSKIEWTTNTFNPWEGCTKVSAGCQNCYAEAQAKRFGRVQWGPNGTRRVASENYWRQPINWNKKAEGAAERPRVFCASLADVFEDWQGPMMDNSGFALNAGPVGDGTWDKSRWWIANHTSSPLITMDDCRRRLFNLIDATPNLDWLVLTKRPENIARMMPAYFPGGYIAEAGRMNQEGPRPNVWLGTSVEDQAAADTRIPHLLNIPAVVRFLSMEPLLGPVDLTRVRNPGGETTFGPMNSFSFGIDWAILGGESGQRMRPCDIEWIRSIRDQCKAANVACFIKQLGGKPFDSQGAKDFPAAHEKRSITGLTSGDVAALAVTLELMQVDVTDKKGGDWTEWPDDLQVREFPKVRSIA